MLPTSRMMRELRCAASQPRRASGPVDAVMVVTDLVADAYAGISAVASGATDDHLKRPTRCSGWTVTDLLFHLLLDAQRALVTFNTPADGPPDVDDVSYWAPHKPAAPWAAEHEDYVRRSTAAFASPAHVVGLWVQTAAAAGRAAAAADPTWLVATQGHVLTAADFASTLVVEAAVHHLDLTVDMPAAPPPSDDVLHHVRDVFDRMLGFRGPGSWRDTDYILAAGGRTPIADDVADTIGPAVAARFPLLG
jgi:uncharacterized protein (TIGR03083 family)